MFNAKKNRELKLYSVKILFILKNKVFLALIVQFTIVTVNLLLPFFQTINQKKN